MKKNLKPRKIPQQERSRRTRDEILEATTRLLGRFPLSEISTNHIAAKTGISIGTLYKYYPNKDSILTDLSLRYMQQDADLFEQIFIQAKGRSRRWLLDALVNALMQIHREESAARGVVYQNLERLKLVQDAKKATASIHASGAAALSSIDPALMWVAISSINAAIHSMSQLPTASQDWHFANGLCRRVLEQLLTQKK